MGKKEIFSGGYIIDSRGDKPFSFMGGRQEKILEDIRRNLKQPVLDVGCNRGNGTNYFAGRGIEIEGCDINESAIKEAQSRFPNIKFFVHDFEEKKLGKKYNTIYCANVIEHIFDYRSFLKNMKASLNPGGRLIITTPNVMGLASWMRFICRRTDHLMHTDREYGTHIRFFTKKTLEEELERAGFSVEKIYGYSSFLLWLPASLCGLIMAVAKVKKWAG